MNRKILFIVFLGLVSLTAVIRSALASEEPIPIHFFYSKGCSSCAMINKTFPKLELKYKDKIAIYSHEISDPGEFKLMLIMEKEYGITRGMPPEIFLPNAVLKGKRMIMEKLDGAIEEILEKKSQGVREEPISERILMLDRFSTFSPAVITFAGLIDGINPCAFATMVFFISFLSLSNYRKRQIIYIGSAFIIAVFLTYLALGLGIFQVFKKMQIFSFFSQAVYYAIALLALGLGVYSLRDYIRYKRTGQTKGCSLKVYNRLRSLVDNKRGLVILIAGAFVSGFIIALLESVCTGQVYFPIIAFVMRVPKLRLHAFSYLVLYNLAFILPLVGVFLFTYRGLTSEKLALFTNRHLGAIKLATAFLFFGLAALLFIV